MSHDPVKAVRGFNVCAEFLLRKHDLFVAYLLTTILTLNILVLDEIPYVFNPTCTTDSLTHHGFTISIKIRLQKYWDE